MEKVRVARYVAGKAPKYAPHEKDDDESEEIFDRSGAEVRDEDETSEASDEETEMDVDDRRIKRLMLNKPDEPSETRRRVREPEILEIADDDMGVVEEEDEEAGSEDISDDEIERRRISMREKAKEREEEKDVLDVEEEMKSEEEEEEESEYETESESEDEAPRLKPVFIRKQDRVTVKEREKREEAETRFQENNKRAAQMRKKESVRLAGEAVRREIQEEQGGTEDTEIVADFNTDDENEEEEV
jgi:microfibrillar-associated protein 1